MREAQVFKRPTSYGTDINDKTRKLQRVFLDKFEHCIVNYAPVKFNLPLTIFIVVHTNNDGLKTIDLLLNYSKV